GPGNQPIIAEVTIQNQNITFAGRLPELFQQRTLFTAYWSQARLQGNVVEQVVEYDSGGLHKFLVLVVVEREGSAQTRRIGQVARGAVGPQEPPLVPAFDGTVRLIKAIEISHDQFIEVREKLRLEFLSGLRISARRRHSRQLPDFAEDFVESILL